MANLSELLKLKNAELKNEAEKNTQSLLDAIDMQAFAYQVESYFTHQIPKLNFEVSYLTADFLMQFVNQADAQKLLEDFQYPFLFSKKVQAYLESEGLGKLRVDIVKKNAATLVATVTIQL